MGLFDFLKKKNAAPQPATISANSTIDPAIAQFDEQVFNTVARYICKPGAVIDLKLKNRETNEIMTFAAAYPEQFNNWKKVKSGADKRGIIYGILDEQMGGHLALWQVMERYNDDRYPQEALKIAIEHADETAEQQADFHAAFARSYFILQEFALAEKHCLMGLAIDAAHIRTKRIYADVLHCTNMHEQAHALYEEILSAKLPKDKEMSLPIQHLLGFDGDIVNSPVYAFSWLSNSPSMPQEIWDWANDEFYYSPYFRSQHAYWLLDRGEHMPALAKLFTLVKEMPWCKEAATNCLSLIEQLGMKDNMVDERKWLEGVVKGV
ncbi:hypothetical protein LX64_01675 [Chitinophaga skermanii]|uniref:Tetratricopeptide repeat protein n=1 Tax=Chitinophaga skermanii TaxID=331697 RepID=A0A327QR85_9BACT|nr:hypothetical protein [Chitinophaga skermanii]RAJ06548.1 hypothetical protein LX64_01675 [Chitinophaga skermanii]